MASNILTRESYNIESNLYFLSRDPVYDEVKPYSLRYIPNGDLPQTNLKPEKHRVNIADMRDFEDSLNFNSTGFGVIHLNSCMVYDDFHDPAKVRDVFFNELRYALKSTFDANEVHIMDYVLRKRHDDFPISSGEEYEFDQPTTLAHIDFSIEGAAQMIHRDMGDRAEALLQGKWRVVNIWKPLRGPLRDWPLAVCSADSVDFDRDTMPGDVVMSKQLVEDVHINYAQDQKWYYLSEQKTTELLIFQSADSEGKYGAPHASFQNPKSCPSDPPRESIDLRAFIFY